MVNFRVMFVLFLTGCSHFSMSERQQVSALVIAKCPVLQNYSLEQQTKAADELARLASDSQIAAMVTDYGKMRDACRAITRELTRK